MGYLEQHNAHRKPFVCTASARAILEKPPARNELWISTLGGQDVLATNIW
jgi:hypothetical protein